MSLLLRLRRRAAIKGLKMLGNVTMSAALTRWQGQLQHAFKRSRRLAQPGMKTLRQCLYSVHQPATETSTKSQLDVQVCISVGAADTAEPMSMGHEPAEA